jgi:2,4-dienoyl-CoA reductase-like NADH-dependent reductase (Old Yellow Enzyme family)/thioredoxin reductase
MLKASVPNFLTQLARLFEPINIGKMRVKNRIVFPAVGTRFADAIGDATQRDVNHFRARAVGGAGLLVVPWVLVDTKLGKKVGRLRLDNDEYIRGMHEIVDVVHSNGSKVAIQLAHPGRAMTPEETPDGAAVSSSEFYSASFGTKARALSLNEIEYLIDAFANAALRAKRAGFDAVEYHGANGYLISQFLSPFVNKRDDQYGGSPSRRMNFLLEIVKRTRERTGQDYPLMVRISADEFIDGGLTLQDSKEIARALVDSGVNCIDVNVGIIESYHKSMPPMAVPRGAFVHLAAGIKSVVEVPVIAVGRINTPLLAEKILQEKKADLIAMGRALLADPELPNKARRGAYEDIIPCIACNRCEMATSENLPVRCTVNPRLGRETEYTLTRAQEPKHVCVVGGGPAGMTAAAVAALRGHKVQLYEKQLQLGGQLRLASVPPHKEELLELLKYLELQLRKAGVEVLLGREFRPELVTENKPDVIIVATGATPIEPKIAGADLPNVAQAWDILNGREAKGRVVVVGAGCQGCETAEFLAAKGKDVTIVEMLPELAWDMEPFTKILLLERFEKYRVKVHKSTTVTKIRSDGIDAKDKDGRHISIDADTVVICVGSRSNNGLLSILDGSVNEVYGIGDCEEPARLLEAMHAGTHVGHKI